MHRLLAPLAACCLLLHAPALALAAGESTPLNLPADQPRKLDTVGGGSSGLVRTLVGLAVVIAVIYGVAWVLRQVKSAKEERTSGYGLEHAATIPLGPNRSLHLVRAGRELVLLGSAEHGVVPIRTYSEAEARSLGLVEDDEPLALMPGPGPASGTAVVVAKARTAVDRLRDLTVRA
ncbi:MAG: flagellar protein FliO/FliZ [Solirubrobacteraceae bacterium]|jgi:flagellar protein FliO/FliZ|nr:flagellar protein FliO/FliZ [Solirubrobacteraceae bacterium]